jgi:hypothetical protein
MLGWVLGAALALALALAPGGVHRIEEGHVGIYWFGGALLPFTTDPGYHWAPSIFSHDQVQVTMQTDKVTNIPVRPRASRHRAACVHCLTRGADRSAAPQAA